MKKTTILTIVTLLVFTLGAFKTTSKLISSKTHIKFFSSTPAEDIESNNYKAVSTLDTGTGEVIFSVPMQSFEFEKSLMQKHFNGKKFLDTKRNPKAKLIGQITNLPDINFEKDGIYDTQIEGKLTIKGVTKPITEKGTLTVKGKTLEVNSTFKVTLADYEIAFEKGKPSTNIAETLDITVFAEYNPK